MGTRQSRLRDLFRKRGNGFKTIKVVTSIVLCPLVSRKDLVTLIVLYTFVSGTNHDSGKFLTILFILYPHVSENYLAVLIVLCPLVFGKNLATLIVLYPLDSGQDLTRFFPKTYGSKTINVARSFPETRPNLIKPKRKLCTRTNNIKFTNTRTSIVTRPFLEMKACKDDQRQLSRKNPINKDLGNNYMYTKI